MTVLNTIGKIGLSSIGMTVREKILLPAAAEEEVSVSRNLLSAKRKVLRKTYNNRKDR
jgi:hypothetical protein